MKYFSPLSPKDCLCLAGVFLFGFGWLLIDQFLLASVLLRFFALIFILCALFYLQYRISKPEIVFIYINSITLVSMSFMLLISLVVHLLINNDFSLKTILIWMVTASIPYLAGIVYLKTRKNSMQ